VDREDFMTCPFITFHSFRGGTGCSTAVLQVGKLLAAAGSRVLILDMDLDSPGLSYLAHNTPGVVRILIDAVYLGEDADLFQESPTLDKYTFKLPSDGTGSLHLMTAGQMDMPENVEQKVLDLDQLYLEGSGLALMGVFKEVVQGTGRFDYVLVDAGSGNTPEAGICIRDLADAVIMFSTISPLCVAGTQGFLARIREKIKQPLDIVLSPIPPGGCAPHQRDSEVLLGFQEAWGSPLSKDLRIPYDPGVSVAELVSNTDPYQKIVDRIRNF